MIKKFSLTADERIALVDLWTEHLRNPDDWRPMIRVTVLLDLHGGVSLEELAEYYDISPRTIYNWINRFLEDRSLSIIDRITDKPKSGRPRTREISKNEEVYERFKKNYWEKFGKEPPSLDQILSGLIESTENKKPPRADRGEN